MTTRRSKAYVWSSVRKELKTATRIRRVRCHEDDVNALIWATIYCRTSSMRVGYAYTMLRKRIKVFEDKWGPLTPDVIQKMSRSPIGRYVGTMNAFVFPTLKKAVNIVYPRGKPCIS